MSTTPIKIDSTLVFQLFGDPAFYTDNPCFLALEDAGKAAHAQYLEMVAKKKTGCTGCQQKVLMATLGNFAKLVKRLHEVAPAEIERFMVYLTKRTGRRPPYALLYYKDRSGKMQELQFGHPQGG